MRSTNFFRLLIFIAAICAGIFTARAEPIEISGITEPFTDVTLGLADPGIIRQQFFHEGDSVQKGDVILELDKNLETIEVLRRKAIMDQNESVYESTQQLSDTTKSVSQQDLTKAKAEYEVAAADYATAVQQLTNRELIAPFSGTITEISLKPGAAVAPYQPLVRLVDTSRCYFIGNIDGKLAGSLQINEAVKIQTDDGQTVSAKISFISPTVDAASGLVRVKAIFENADARIRPGLAAKMITE